MPPKNAPSELLAMPPVDFSVKLEHQRLFLASQKKKGAQKEHHPHVVKHPLSPFVSHL